RVVPAPTGRIFTSGSVPHYHRKHHTTRSGVFRLARDPTRLEEPGSSASTRRSGEVGPVPLPTRWIDDHSLRCRAGLRPPWAPPRVMPAAVRPGGTPRDAVPPRCERAGHGPGAAVDLRLGGRIPPVPDRLGGRAMALV